MTNILTTLETDAATDPDAKSALELQFTEALNTYRQSGGI